MKLADKAAIITGGGRGIGQAGALELAREGAAIVISDIAEHDEVEDTLAQIEQMGGNGMFIKTDVGDEDQVLSLVDQTVETFGRVDILVNCAGASDPAMLTNMTLDKWFKVINSHLTGSFLCTREVARHMKPQNYGTIIFVSSIAGSEGTIGQCNYGAAKGGMLGLMKSCAKELARYNINVNAVSPGVVETAMTETIRGDEKFREATLSRILMGEFATPDMIAPMFRYLASEEGHYIHGQTIYVDGGMFGL
ncbi:MAG: 3-oxoacyl-ACP reductase FabG [Rhodospirillales bacterium]|jgi:3-oxoacyl-[acyl-carrier protein] reductase|nr:3-oxoacyl-ACP reductase FabG [Rhodospirillales bacterium]